MAGYQMDVILQRDSLYTPWGFRLEGGIEYSRPLRVQRVHACGASEGQLRPGDQIIAVEGYDASRLTHQQATELIASSGSTLRVTIVRSPDRARSQPPKRMPVAAKQPTPTMQAVQSSSRTGQNDDETPIPKNSALAKMMMQSISQPQEPRKGGLAGIDLLLRHPRPGQDISDYLPRPAPRSRTAGGSSGRTTPLPPMSYMTTSSSSSAASSTPLPHMAAQSATLPSASRRANLGTRLSAPRESQIRSQLWDSVVKATGPGSGHGGSEHGSGRSTPQSVVAFEFGSPAKPTAVGVWTAPPQHPSARLVHAQYNSPMAMYAPHNVADMIEKQTGTKLAWQKKPSVRFLDDISDSPTYKFIHSMETSEEHEPVTGRTRGQQHQPPSIAQSYSFRRIDHALRSEDDHHHDQSIGRSNF